MLSKLCAARAGARLRVVASERARVAVDTIDRDLVALFAIEHPVQRLDHLLVLALRARNAEQREDRRRDGAAWREVLAHRHVSLRRTLALVAREREQDLRLRRMMLRRRTA